MDNCFVKASESLENLKKYCEFPLCLNNKMSQQQNCSKLYHYTQLEVAPKFYVVHSMLCTRKISVNIMAQKLLIVK